MERVNMKPFFEVFMSFEAMSWAIRQKTKSAGSKLVLLLLANHANGYSGQCNPSHKLLADECEMSVSALKVHIKCLESQELLSIHRASRDGVSLPNQYALHLNKVGQNLTDGVRICPKVGQNLMEGGSESDGGVGQNLATNQEVKPGIKPVTETAQKDPIGFASFWQAYPKKTAKPAALLKFKSAKLKAGELDAILTDIETRKQADDWTKENGKYVPNPATYLSQRRWEDGETAHTAKKIGGVLAGAI
jgi:hypothetical protein